MLQLPTQHGACTGAKGTWRTLWLTFMKELAPQTPEGAYERPSYQFSFKQTEKLQVPHTVLLSSSVAPGMPGKLEPKLKLKVKFKLMVVYLQAESGRYVLYVGNACPW